MKSLYLYKNKFDLRDPIPADRMTIFKRGTDVGIKARDIFPGGKDASPKDVFSYRESVAQTQKFIEEGETIIYEAAFQFEGVLAALDILVKKNEKWYAYEVKSSAKVSGNYVLDAALQFYVITNSGLALEDIYIVNLNTDYVRQGAIEPRKLFKATSILKEVLKKQEGVKEKIIESKKTLLLNEEPAIDIGSHCFEPYPCDFMGYCRKSVPAGSVFEITGMQREKQFELYHNGIQKIEDLPEGQSLRKNEKLQVDFYNKNEPYIDKSAIEKFLSELKYPLYFMDFETFMPAIPMFDGTSPFQHLPFQYSIHFKNEKNSDAIHKGFLAEQGINPCKSFIEHLLKDTQAMGDILVYNLSFERGVLKKLRDMYPEFAVEITERINRMKDLMQPFEKRHYYHPEMKGSHSIKNVLPALVPGFSYNGLAIGNGNAASNAFEQLQSEMDLFKISEIREQLTEYCKMDTFAMVKIFEVLENYNA
jgi:hypothetical protein